MVASFFTGKGQAVRLGQQLGKGGEGAVFDVTGQPGVVAKLYHAALDAEKQAKLVAMPTLGDPKLLDYTAWPQETLHERVGGPVKGFLMPSVGERQPIHMLYSPAHRRQDYPKAAWDFLLAASRNMAACFKTLHEHGHLVGDVNQGNAMVGKDARVMLIDCDSFQVNANGKLHLCEVGVSHFTPPELQGSASFDTVTRTENHDNFGLALLVFHTLFGGRHPYSGVPVGNDGGEIESNIKALRYAYAPNAQTRGLVPPPRSIPMNLVPDEVGAMFMRAFTEEGPRGRRPTAKQWVEALDGIRNHLKVCSASKMHVYPGHRSTCPWCELEGRGIIYFMNVGATFIPTNTGFVLEAVWAQIEAVGKPSYVIVPDYRKISVVAKPGNAGQYRTRKLVVRLFVLVAAVVAFAAVPSFAFFTLIGAIVAFLMAGKLGESERSAERTRRLQVCEASRDTFSKLEQQARTQTGPAQFDAKRSELSKLRDEYRTLPEVERSKLEELSATAAARQRRAYLERQFIDTASIPGVGPAKKAALRSFGIETAQDVTWQRVIVVKGFGEVRTRAVVNWRSERDRKFVFNARTAVSDADKSVVRARVDVRKRAIEDALKRAPGELLALHQVAAVKSRDLKPRLEEAATALAQAEADVAAA